MLKRVKSNNQDCSSVDSIVNNAMQNLKTIVDVNTIVGSPVETIGGSTIIPISKISVGFVAGGGEFNNNHKNMPSFDYPFAGGSGAGFTVVPIGFLSEKNGEVTYIDAQTSMAKNEFFELKKRIFKTVLENIKEDKKWEFYEKNIF